MTHLRRLFATLVLLLCANAAFAQTESIIVEAESGAVGSQFSIVTEDGVTYAAIQSTVGGFNPTTDARVISFTVTFPSPGIYELYGRLRVGPGTFNDDSFYYANGFGTKNPASNADWVLANGLAGTVGFTLPSDKVVGGGVAQSNVWKWVKLSAFDGGAPPVSFPVDASSLTRTFQVAGREDGLLLDKFAFGRQGVFFTVFDLDNGLPGTTVPPPPPFTPPGPPIATGQPKFLGGVSSPSQNLNFTAYWNQVTPENGGKWGSVEGTRNDMNWGELDTAYALAKNNGFPFRHAHADLGESAARLDRERCHGRTADRDRGMVRRRRQAIPRHRLHRRRERAAARSAGRPGRRQLHRSARRRRRQSGWEWVLRSFRLARRYFPNASLGINEFSVTNNPTDCAALPRHHRAVAGGRADRHDRRAGARILHARAQLRDHGQPRSPVDSSDCPSTSRSWTSTARPTRSSSRTISGSSRRSGSTRRPRHHALGLQARALAHRAGGLHRPGQRGRAARDGLAAGVRRDARRCGPGPRRTGRRGPSRSETACRSPWTPAAPRRWPSSGGGTASPSRATRPPRPRLWCSPA